MSEINHANRLNISTFGGLSICVGDEPVVGFASRKAEALLVYLAVTGREQPREALADLLWDDRSQDRAASNLRTVLASLRKCLGDYISITRHTAALNRDANQWVDAVKLEKVTRDIQDKGGVFWPSEARLLGETIGSYNGDFLSGFNIRGCRDFEDWMLLEREHLYQQVMSGLEGLADYLIERGDYQVGIVLAQRWVQLNPIMETAQRKLMRLLVYAGRTADALAQFETCSQILQNELGLEPSHQTRELYNQILASRLAAPEPKPIREPAFLNKPPAFLNPQIPDRAEFPVFVARQRQLDRLHNCLASAGSGEGQVVFVTGGPGRGKTALLGKFARDAMAANPDLLVAMGRCNAYEGVGDYYLPFRDAIGMLAGDVESMWEAGAITSNHARFMWNAAPLTAGAVLEHGPHLLNTFLSSEELLARAEMSAQDEKYRLAQLREEISRGRTAKSTIEQSYLFEQYANVLGALSRNQPLLLLLDDLQWADSSSIALLFHLGRRLPGTRILLAAAYRPDEVALGREGGRHPLEKILSEFKLQYGDVWIDLADMQEQEGREFVDELLDSEANLLDNQFRKALFKRTGGYALFTVELLRMLQERGFLVVNQEGYWQASPELDWERLPARVEAVVEERIGRLEAELRDILSVASVEGEDFTAQVVGGIQQVDERDLMRTLAQELEKRHRLVIGQGSIRLNQRILSRYRFVHALFQQYLYNELDDAERALLHRQIGQVLEELYNGQTDLIAEQLAFHFRGDNERERYYSRIAGEKAAARYANAEALRYFRRTLELIPDENSDERRDLLLRCESIYHIQGDRSAQKAVLVSLRELVECLDDDQKKIEVFLRQARYDGKTGHFPAVIANAQDAILLADAALDFYSQAEGYLHWGTALWVQGDNKAAKEMLKHSLDLARSSGHIRVEAKVLRIIGGISNEPLDPQYLHQALEIYRQIGDLAGESKALNNLGARACYDTQEFVKAKSFLEGGLAISRKTGYRDGEFWLVHNLAALHTYVGNYSSAWDCLQQSITIVQDINYKRGHTMCLISLGEYYTQLGAYPKALNSFEQSLTAAREIVTKGFEIESLCGLSLIYHHLGEHQTALDHAQNAMLLAEEMDDFFILCGSRLGLVYEGLGNPEKAAGGFNLAVKRSLEIDMPLFAAENNAGLARLALAQGDISKAQMYIAEILEFIEWKLPQITDYVNHDLGAATPFDGTDEPFLIYLTCYHVLLDAADPRTGKILASAYNLLQARAANIENEELRRSYFEDVPHHKALITAWTKNPNNLPSISP